MKFILSFVILIATSFALLSCSSEQTYLNAEHKNICSDDNIFQPFVASEYKTYNLGDLPKKTALYQPKPEGGSRQGVIYENEEYLKLKKEICKNGITKEEYSKLLNQIYKAPLSSPAVFTSSDKAQKPSSKIAFHGNQVQLDDHSEYNFVARYIPGVSLEFWIKQAGKTVVVAFIDEKEIPESMSEIKKYTCEKLHLIKTNLQLGDTPAKLKIPSCKELLAAELKYHAFTK